MFVCHAWHFIALYVSVYIVMVSGVWCTKQESTASLTPCVTIRRTKKKKNNEMSKHKQYIYRNITSSSQYSRYKNDYERGREKTVESKVTSAK